MSTVTGNRYAVWPGWDAYRHVIHAVVEQVDDYGRTDRATVCAETNPGGLQRGPGHFVPNEPTACPACVSTWRAALAPKLKRCINCGDRLPPDLQSHEGGVTCHTCQAAPAFEEPVVTDEHARLLHEAAKVVSFVQAFQDDRRFPSLFCRYGTDHGPYTAAVDTDTASPQLACRMCGHTEPVPADWVHLLTQYGTLSTDTLALLPG